MTRQNKVGFIVITKLTCNDIGTAILCGITKQGVGVSDEKLCDNCLHADTLQNSHTALHLLQFFTPSHTQQNAF